MGRMPLLRAPASSVAASTKPEVYTLQKASQWSSVPKPDSSRSICCDHERGEVAVADTAHQSLTMCGQLWGLPVLSARLGQEYRQPQTDCQNWLVSALQTQCLIPSSPGHASRSHLLNPTSHSFCLHPFPSPCLSFFRDQISCSPGWPRTGHVSQGWH